VVNDSALVRGIEDSLTADGKPLLDVWMSHGDKVTAIPSDFVTVASTDNCPFAIMANEEKRFYGVQFHPEVTHTRQGCVCWSASCATSASAKPCGPRRKSSTTPLSVSASRLAMTK
jgi:GMP synthase (glutamine-hydrolysing)